VLGRALDSRDVQPINVHYKRIPEHESHCLVCHDGGLLTLCSLCPRGETRARSTDTQGTQRQRVNKGKRCLRPLLTHALPLSCPRVCVVSVCLFRSCAPRLLSASLL
jgi:hypothetical protein